MKIPDYLQTFRITQVDFAQSLGVTQGLVGFWVRGKAPSPARCMQIERATKGHVTRRDLRPHDCEEIWPDLSPTLANTAQAPQEPLVLLSSESKPIDPNDPGLRALLQRPAGGQSQPVASGSV